MGNQQASKSLTDRDVQILIETSGKSEREILQWYTEFHEDSHGTDRMNKRQFQNYYLKLRNRPNLQQITDHIFRAFDIDQSGTIDFNEFLIAYIATSEGTPRQKFTYAFEVYDMNDDEIIEKKEIKKILNIICRLLGFSEHDAASYSRSMMLSFDTNRDRVLSKSEFVEGCLHDPTLGKLSNPFDL
ncbi:unnamed protein product [Adineta ricciae]|uniref:EF-hand domain-containing protein n=1 Tax=Adineta ricciae TaxID=249248 RepID=A0A814LHG3_ADIRI|nr:unnamed protein product [Adineta ricciae]CAF1578284.1 unnamed protein product [Adineta ricciae]